MGGGRDRRILLLALLGGTPGALVALRLLWLHVPSQAARWTLTALILGVLFGCALALQAQVVRPLQLLANLLSAIREGDYSLRAGPVGREDSFGAALSEASAIADVLRGQRLDSLEAAAFLGAVMGEIEVAVFAFEDKGPQARLRLCNRAGARLLGAPAEALAGRTAAGLGLAEALAAEAPTTLELSLPGAGAAEAGLHAFSRWEARTRTFRQGGLPHRVLVLSDLRRALREEERQAWQRLIRVLSHEINNSLTPIQSIAQSLQVLLERGGVHGEVKQDLERGLQVIGGRADAVGRFMAAYAQLARLPAPRPSPLEVEPWVRRAALLEVRAPVAVEGGPPLTLHADRDQLDQVLINLLHNAAEAAQQTGGEVTVRWRRAPPAAPGGPELFELVVQDGGPGLPPAQNLFVPFFTTKPSGSGIGLVLSRQIAEAHGGQLLLRDRQGAKGAEAVLRLPLAAGTLPA